MKILIGGNGQVGHSVALSLLDEGHDVTVIDRSYTEDERIHVLRGNCATVKTLKDAGVEEADLIIAVTDSDEINLLTCMTAHIINPDILTIARMRSVEYEETANEIGRQFGLSLSVNPHKQAAEEICHLIKYPGYLKRDRFAYGTVEIIELSVGHDSVLKKQPLYQMENIVHCQTIVCAIVRNGQAIVPSGDMVIEEGDHIFVTASEENITTLLGNLGLLKNKVNSVLLIGDNSMAVYTARQLLEDGVEVKMVTSNNDRVDILKKIFPKAEIILSDPSFGNMNIQNEINNCDAVVSLTDEDEKNILIGVLSNHMNKSKVIIKLEYDNYLKSVDTISAGTAINPKHFCSDTITRFVKAVNRHRGEAVTIHRIVQDQIEASEFIVDEQTEHKNIPLSRLPLKEDVLLTSITREGKIIFPKGDTVITDGDRLVVVTDASHTPLHINDIFE